MVLRNTTTVNPLEISEGKTDGEKWRLQQRQLSDRRVIQTGVRIIIQGVVRDARNLILILPVMQGAYAARRQLETPYLYLFWSLSRGSQRGYSY